MRHTTVPIEEEFGCRCEVAHNRDEALRLLQDHAAKIAVVFTDLRMATENDGAELARIVSRRWPWIAILVTSSGAPFAAQHCPQKPNLSRSHGGR
jgi:CheY-like chemotaxis protein